MNLKEIKNKETVKIGTIKIHYIGPDEYPLAPYIYEIDGKYKRNCDCDLNVCYPGKWYDLHDVVYYDRNIIVTSYECRFYMFSTFKRIQLHGYYDDGWVIYKESLDEFYNSIKSK